MNSKLFTSFLKVFIIWWTVLYVLHKPVNHENAGFFNLLAQSWFIAIVCAIGGCLIAFSFYFNERRERIREVKGSDFNGSNHRGMRLTLGVLPKVKTLRRSKASPLPEDLQEWGAKYRSSYPKHAKLIEAGLEMMKANPCPASPVKGGHGDLNLTQHSFNVLREIITAAPKWKFTGSKNKKGEVVSPLQNPEYVFDKGDPVIPIVAMLHDIGKMMCYQVNPDGSVKELRPNHDIQGGKLVVTLPEFWDLAKADRDLIALCLTYYHHPMEMPEWADDRTKAVTELLIYSDNRAGRKEGGLNYQSKSSFVYKSENKEDDLQLAVIEEDDKIEEVIEADGGATGSRMLNALSDLLAETDRVNGSNKEKRIAFKSKGWVFVQDKRMREELAKELEDPSLIADNGVVGYVNPKTEALMRRLDTIDALFKVLDGYKFGATSAFFNTQSKNAEQKVLSDWKFVIIIKASAFPALESLPDCPIHPEIVRPSWGWNRAKDKKDGPVNPDQDPLKQDAPKTSVTENGNETIEDIPDIPSEVANILENADFGDTIDDIAEMEGLSTDLDDANEELKNNLDEKNELDTKPAQNISSTPLINFDSEEVVEMDKKEMDKAATPAFKPDMQDILKSLLDEDEISYAQIVKTKPHAKPVNAGTTAIKEEKIEQDKTTSNNQDLVNTDESTPPKNQSSQKETEASRSLSVEVETSIQAGLSEENDVNSKELNPSKFGATSNNSDDEAHRMQVYELMEKYDFSDFDDLTMTIHMDDDDKKIINESSLVVNEDKFKPSYITNKNHVVISVSDDEEFTWVREGHEEQETAASESPMIRKKDGKFISQLESDAFITDKHDMKAEALLVAAEKEVQENNNKKSEIYVNESLINNSEELVHADKNEADPQNEKTNDSSSSVLSSLLSEEESAPTEDVVQDFNANGKEATENLSSKDDQVSEDDQDEADQDYHAIEDDPEPIPETSYELANEDSNLKPTESANQHEDISEEIIEPTLEKDDQPLNEEKVNQQFEQPFSDTAFTEIPEPEPEVETESYDYDESEVAAQVVKYGPVTENSIKLLSEGFSPFDLPFKEKAVDGQKYLFYAIVVLESKIYEDWQEFKEMVRAKKIENAIFKIGKENIEYIAFKKKESK